MDVKKHVVLICLSFAALTYGQKEEPRWTFNAELGLPVELANPAFKEIMQGLVGASAYMQRKLPLDLNVGLGVKYSYFKINEFSIPEPVFGGMHTGAAYGKIGWGKFHNDRFATDFGLKIGYAQNYYDTDVNKLLSVNPVVQAAFYTEFVTSLILTADEKNSYRWIIGYGSFGRGFNPADIGIQSNEGYDPETFARRTQYLIVGFGYTYYLGVKGGD